jgi:hypothetical protein
MVAFGDIPKDTIMRNVFGDLPGEGEGPPVFDFRGDPLVPIPVLLAPNTFGDQFNHLGGNLFFDLGGDAQEGDPPPQRRFKWTCTAPYLSHPNWDPGLSTDICCPKNNEGCIQVPEEWCGMRIHPSLPPDCVVKCFDTKEECEQNECCKEDRYPVPPDEPKDPPVVTDMCWEVKAVKRLESQVNIVIERDPAQDVGTADNPDPNRPRGKAYSLKAYIDEYAWKKTSVRECFSLNRQGNIKPRTTDIKVGLIVRPTLEEAFLSTHGGPPVPVGVARFWDDYNHVVDITYDLEFEIDINPYACNRGCVDFPSTDDLVFASFCGGSERKKNTTSFIEKTFNTSWDNENGEVSFAQAAGLLTFADRDNAAAQPPGYGLVNTAHFNDTSLPFAVNEAAVMTFKESLVLNLMLNLDMDTYGGQLTSYFGLNAPTLLYQSLEQIEDVEFCIPQFNAPSQWMWQRVTGATGENAFMPNDSYFQRKDLNYLFKKFNQYAMVPTDKIGYRLVGGY